MQKMIVTLLLVLTMVILNACINLSESNVSEVKIIQDGATVYTFTKEEHQKEISILVKAVNKVKNQRSEVDMPPSDYTIEFLNIDHEAQSYLLWLDSNSAFLLDNSTSDFVQLSSPYTEKLNQIVTDHHADGFTTFNFFFLVAGFPILIIFLMLVDLNGSRKRDS